ncbi:MAG: helix-turn-helix domain-containing protein [Flavipsychrobacter sp.]|nr:helix-turn-helix domain-containing protein [Flavipsychrobacter sp.]
MKHISIIVPRGAILGSLEGSRQVFSQVNQFCAAQGMPPAFHVQLVGIDMETPVSGGRFTVHADVLFNHVTNTDLIIIPAIDGDLKEGIANNRKFIPWIKGMYAGGAEVASLCLGAFLLAATGLLNGRKAATHWVAANEFRIMFPEVNLVDNKIVTEENGIYCSGGAFSYLNLLLHLVEKLAGRDMAILCAKVFAIEIDRKGQSPFMIFHGQKGHEDTEVRKAQDFIEQHYTEKITVDQLADKFAVGRRSFERRFKKATGNTVAEYINRVKIEAAKKELEAGRKNVNEVMYDMGYTDNKNFRTLFKKLTGLSPMAYRARYTRSALSA